MAATGVAMLCVCAAGARAQSPAAARLPVVAGDQVFALLVQPSGAVRVWGRSDGSSRRSLGDGRDPSEAPASISEPQPLAGIHNAIGAAVGATQALILRADGTVVGWGRNDRCEVGNGGTPDPAHQELEPVFAPVPVDGLRGVAQLAASDGISGAVRADGSVWMWGRGDGGLLANGVFEPLGAQPPPPCAPRPRKVEGLSGITQLAIGVSHVLALRNDGTVWAWGTNEDGQLGDGTRENRGRPVQVTGITSAVSIAAGQAVSAAVMADGTVRTWGSDVNGRLGGASSEESGVRVRPGVVPGITGATAVLAFTGGFTARGRDGTLRSWGEAYFDAFGNAGGQRLSSPTGLGPVVAHFAAGYRLFAIRTDGTVMAWGQLNMMTPGGLVKSARTPVVAVKPGP